MTALASIRSLIDRGALFVINHSAGKDSQAMTIALKRMIPADQLLVIHADLGRVEWDGVQGHIRDTIGNLPLIVCRNENKTLLEMVERRGMWPSPGQRQCTSDLKRGPIEREIRRYLKANPHFGGLVVNCMGIRAPDIQDCCSSFPPATFNNFHLEIFDDCPVATHLAFSLLSSTREGERRAGPVQRVSSLIQTISAKQRRRNFTEPLQPQKGR